MCTCVGLMSCDHSVVTLCVDRQRRTLSHHILLKGQPRCQKEGVNHHHVLAFALRSLFSHHHEPPRDVGISSPTSPEGRRRTGKERNVNETNKEKDLASGYSPPPLPPPPPRLKVLGKDAAGVIALADYTDSRFLLLGEKCHNNYCADEVALTVQLSDVCCGTLTG